MRQVVRVREVESCLVHLKGLEHIDEEVLIIAISILSGCEKRNHLGLGHLVDAVLAYLGHALPFRHHYHVVTFQESNEAH